jgi:hypothetical protein
LDAVESVNLVNEEEGVEWIFSFLSADKKKTYCLYEAPNPEAIRAAARRLNMNDRCLRTPAIAGPSSKDKNPLLRDIPDHKVILSLSNGRQLIEPPR